MVTPPIPHSWAVTAWNLAVGYRVAPSWKVSGKISNLLDKEYQTSVGYPADEACLLCDGGLRALIPSSGSEKSGALPLAGPFLLAPGGSMIAASHPGELRWPIFSCSTPVWAG